MKKHMAALSLMAGICAATFVFTACTQMPTEKQGISDLRPQIAFKADGDRVHSARVLLDGLDIGAVNDYIDGKTAARILPGTHRLRVVNGDEVLLDEKFYIGDGVSRSFILK